MNEKKLGVHIKRQQPDNIKRNTNKRHLQGYISSSAIHRCIKITEKIISRESKKFVNKSYRYTVDLLCKKYLFQVHTN